MYKLILVMRLHHLIRIRHLEYGLNSMCSTRFIRFIRFIREGRILLIRECPC